MRRAADSVRSRAVPERAQSTRHNVKSPGPRGGVQKGEKRRRERRHCGNPVEAECAYGLDLIVGDVQLASEAGDDAEVMFPPVIPATPVGESAASGYCVLSGSGAAVGSGARVPLANTPA